MAEDRTLNLLLCRRNLGRALPQVDDAAGAVLKKARQNRCALLAADRSLQSGDDGGRHPQQGKLTRCQDFGGAVALDEPIRDVDLRSHYD